MDEVRIVLKPKGLGSYHLGVSFDESALPRAFGPYTLLRRLAVGGMAEVYVAKTQGVSGFEKLVALKVIHPRFSQDDHFVQLLVEEAKISVLLNHGNIAQTFDLGCIEDTYFIVMEYIDGADAYRILRRSAELRKSLPVELCVYLVSEVCAGLDYAHRKRDVEGVSLGIVHRDVSPQNVLVSFAGDVKLVDFGIAKAALRGKQTEAGVIKGKYYYMSPEQAWGDVVDHRTDIFATAVVLYELLTGRMMYQEDNIPELLDRVRRVDVEPPETRRPTIPAELSGIVMKALSREPGDRYQTAREFREALTRFLYTNFPTFTSSKLSDLMATLLPSESNRPGARVELAAMEEAPVRSMDRQEYTPDPAKSIIYSLAQTSVSAVAKTAHFADVKGGAAPLFSDASHRIVSDAARRIRPQWEEPEASNVDHTSVDSGDVLARLEAAMAEKPAKPGPSLDAAEPQSVPSRPSPSVPTGSVPTGSVPRIQRPAVAPKVSSKPPPRPLGQRPDVKLEVPRPSAVPGPRSLKPNVPSVSPGQLLTSDPGRKLPPLVPAAAQKKADSDFPKTPPPPPRESPALGVHSESEPIAVPNKPAGPPVMDRPVPREGLSDSHPFLSSIDPDVALDPFGTQGPREPVPPSASALPSASFGSDPFAPRTGQRAIPEPAPMIDPFVEDGPGETVRLKAASAPSKLRWVTVIALLVVVGLGVGWFLSRRPEVTLTIDSVPPGATIVAAGQTVGTTPLAWPGELAVGQVVEVTLRLEGYAEATATINIQEGQNSRMSVLNPISVPIRVTSTPPAEIFINGSTRGMSPVEAQGFTVGQSIEVRAELDGYEPMVERRELAAGNGNITLVLQRSPRR